jgi:uncharacterized membrane protein YoaK (UPF0700 family)
MESIKMVLAFLFGAFVGGLFTQFVLPMIWQPKK